MKAGTIVRANGAITTRNAGVIAPAGSVFVVEDVHPVVGTAHVHITLVGVRGVWLASRFSPLALNLG